VVVNVPLTDGEVGGGSRSNARSRANRVKSIICASLPCSESVTKSSGGKWKRKRQSEEGQLASDLPVKATKSDRR
jgi:hypothetical protein